MPGVFISYRRDDSQGWAARLADDLEEALGPDLVFSDVEIPIGSDFAAVLHRAITACDVLLVVIGPRWAAADDSGRSRLFDPGDWVRTEIEVALGLGKPVIPVPVANAGLPPANRLPDTLRPLLRLQAAPLSARHWHHASRHWPTDCAPGCCRTAARSPPAGDLRTAVPCRRRRATPRRR